MPDKLGPVKKYKVKLSGTFSIVVDEHEAHYAIMDVVSRFDGVLDAVCDEFEGFVSWIEDGVEATEVKD